MEDFLYICDGAYTHRELIKMETNVLKVLDFKLGIPLSYRFLRRYARVRMSLWLSHYISYPVSKHDSVILKLFLSICFYTKFLVLLVTVCQTFSANTYIRTIYSGVITYRIQLCVRVKLKDSSCSIIVGTENQTSVWLDTYTAILFRCDLFSFILKYVMNSAEYGVFIVAIT